jgi:hypothetical protein
MQRQRPGTRVDVRSSAAIRAAKSSGMVLAPHTTRVRRTRKSKANLQGEKNMGDQQQNDRNQDHDRRNQQQKQEDERRRREGISKPQPSKDDQAE